MTQLVINDVVNQIQQEIQIDIQGHGKASIRATARLAGVSDMALRKAFNSANLEPSELAIKLMEQGFSGANLSDWSGIGIPDIAVSTILEYFAFDAGRYCTQQAKLAYKAFAAVGIRTWMQQIKGWQELREYTSLQQPSVRDISEAISSVFCMGTIEPNLVQGLMKSEIGKAYPQLKNQMEAVKQLLPISVEDELITVTNLAKLYMKRGGNRLSSNNTNQGNAKVMNDILISRGMQIRNPNLDAKKNGQPLYLPTQLGKQYGKVVLQEAKGSNKTIQQLRWFPSVLSAID